MNFRVPTYLVFALVFSFTLSQQVRADLYINEVLAANLTSSYDIHFYNFTDWIEIYNDGNQSVNLNGYTITDDINVPDKYLINFSLRVGASSYEVIWADKEDWYAHANFGLDSEGEFVALFDPEGTLVDSFSFGRQLPDVSYGRYPDGSSDFYYMPEPTQARKNKSGISDATNLSDSVIFSQSGGFYEGTQMLELSASSPEAIIRFTKDGSWPDAQSEIYEWPIKLTSNKVLKARVFEPGLLPGPVCTQSYFIDQEGTLPVLSISTNPDYFFSWVSGIYVVGSNGIKGNCIDSAVNFNQPWERTVNFEYYSPDGLCQVNQVVGAKIAGRCSRTRPMKPMAMVSRDKYGKTGIGDYNFFNSKDLKGPKNLYLRNSGTEAYSTYLRDGFMQTLVMDRMDLDYQAYQPLVLYINGDYWGIHNLREKMDEHYVASNYGIDPESIDLLEYNTIGTRDTHQGDWNLYEDFLSYVTNHDLSLPENYEYVKTQMDVEEFMNIHIANIYFENEDWPNNNNKFWRERTPGGKWRWYMYDLDFGFGYWPKTGNSVKWFFENREDSRIAYKLKRNTTFRNEFVQRLASHLNTTFRTERVLSILDSVRVNIDEEIYRHVERWGNPWSYSKWDRNMQEVVDFTHGRTAVVIPQVMDEFDLSGTFQLKLQNVSPGHGEIEIAGVDIPSDFEGFYFTDTPLKLQAIPEFGYQFSGWSGDTSSLQEEIVLVSDADISLSAHFEPAEPINNLYINEFLASNAGGLKDEKNQLEDWIEIYNDNDFPVDLAGLYLSDSAGNLSRFRIPSGDAGNTTVAAKDYMLFWADSEKEDGSLHLDFKLRKSGEGIFLSQQRGESLQIIDSVSFGGQYSDVSFGRSPSDPLHWIFLEPTPEEENREKRLENIFINEFMANNRSVLQDRDGNFDDWIEIYNANDYAVDLAGLCISDDVENLSKFRIPGGIADSTSIPAGGFLILWADDSTEQGALHLNFALDGGGEQIFIGQLNGREIIDSITYPDLISDAPYGRSTDGIGPFSYLLASPGTTNLQPDFQGLYINELMASNDGVVADQDGESDDWIELYNGRETPLNVGGLFLSDSAGKRNMFRISTAYPDSTTIPAKGHLLIWADDSTGQGILHTNFKLSKNGEQVLLSTTTAGEIIDSISYGEQYSNVSFGRRPSDPHQWICLEPTPEEKNHEKRLENIFINEFMANNRSVLQDRDGNFDDWIEIYNANDYTVDLAGLCISDDGENLSKFRIPGGIADSTSIPAGGFLILWADDSTEQGALHLNFALDGGGEQIFIGQLNGREIIDSITYPDLISDAPYGRSTDGIGPFSYLLASPGTTNLQPDFQGLYINELMASNDGVVADQDGESDDWIELYNGRETPLNVGGLFLSDSAGKRNMFRISTAYPDSTTIQAKGHLLIWADDSTEQGILHTNFKLSENGEHILLSSPTAAAIIDSISYGEQHKSLSFGRSSDGSAMLVKQLPTPRAVNFTRSYEGIQISEILVSDQDLFPDEYGEYDDWIELYNSSDRAIDIAGMMINDSLEQNEKYVIPSGFPELTSIAAQNYIVLWADDSIEQGPLHLPFKLRENGEQVGIYSMDGTLIDSLCYPEQSNHFSFGKLEVGVWMKLPPSPGEKNQVDSIRNLYINEYMTDNENRLMDEFGEYNDWFEIYNDNPFPINLAGLYLSDSLAIPDKYRIPGNNPESTIVDAYEYVIVWTDGHFDQGPLHTNFRLSRGGEQLVLSAYDYRQIIDSVSFGKQHSNFSNGRLNDHGPWMDLPPTPGKRNVKPDLSKLFINEIMTINMGTIADNYGEYDDWIELYNGGAEPVDLGGLFIADSIGDPEPFRISSDFPDSTTVAPGQYLMIWADDSTEQGILHTSFKLNRQGEQVALYSYDALSLIDSISYALVPRYHTFGRSSDGVLPWEDMATPSPMKRNIQTIINSLDREVENFNHKIYPNPASERVMLSLNIREPTEVLLKLYNRTGKLVALPVDGFFKEGDFQLSWELKNNAGSPLGPGMYFYVIETKDGVSSGKLIVINNN